MTHDESILAVRSAAKAHADNPSADTERALRQIQSRALAIGQMRVTACYMRDIEDYQRRTH